MSGVLYAKRITTGLWVDVASLCGTSTLTGTKGGPTKLDGFWDGIRLARDAFAVAGEYQARADEGFRAEVGTFPLELLLASDSPAATSSLRDGIKRLFPVGQLVELKLGDADRVLRAIPDRMTVQHQRIQTNDWGHGDQLVQIPFSVYDGALYDETATVETLLANTPKKIFVGNLPGYFVLTAAGFAGSITLEAFRDDGTGSAPAATPYASLQITGATSGSLTIDTTDGVDDAYVGSTHLWNKIVDGTWFFRLGEQRGEEHVWVESSIGATFTYPRRW